MQKELIRNIPVHVGVIMDGNGRWAKARLMPRGYGHRAGMNRMISMARRAKALGIRYLTVYALSTENMSRPREELEGLYNLLRKYFTKNVKELKEEGAGVKIVGDISVFPQDVVTLLEDATKDDDGTAAFYLIFALNYGGRAEIVKAVNTAISLGRSVTEEQFSALIGAGVPDPDLIIRTGKEKRLSNFLTYQSAYSELYFTDVLFPDFTDEEFDKAIFDYSNRERRFGKV